VRTVITLRAGSLKPAGSRGGAKMGVGDSRELRNALARLSDRPASHNSADRPKTVYLVRHTRSEQNSGARQYSEGECCLGIYKMATGFDAPPSKRGFGMLADRAEPMGNFLAPKVEGVFFSPLKRAEITKTAMFGEYEGAPPAGVAEAETSPASPKPLQMPLWFLKERSKRETCGPTCHLADRVRRFEFEFLRRVPMNTFALVGHSVFFRQLVFGSMHPGEAGLLMGNVDAWCVEVPPLDEPDSLCTLRAVYTTNETLEAMPQTLDGLFDLIHLALLVHEGTCRVYLDHRTEGDAPPGTPGVHALFRQRVANALDGERVRYLSSAPATVKRADQMGLQQRLEAEGLRLERVELALRTLSEQAVFAPRPEVVGDEDGDQAGVATSQLTEVEHSGAQGLGDTETAATEVVKEAGGGKWRGISVDGVELNEADSAAEPPQAA